MTVFLAILKVIGWLLLILLLLVLLLLLMVLFVPLRYRIRGTRTEDTQICAQITWLLHLVGFEIYFEENNLSMFFRILCFRRRLEKDSLDEVEEITDTDAAKELREAGYNDIVEMDENLRKLKEAAGNGRRDESFSGETKKESPKERLRRTLGKWLGRPIEKIKSIFAAIRGMLKNIKELTARIWGMVSDKGNQAAFKILLGELGYLLKKLKPKKMKVDAEFSTGSPDTTGQLLGVLSLIPAVYQKGWRIVPDFTAEEFYLKGTADARGRLFLYQVLGMGIRIIANKNCRRFLKQFT